MCKRVVLQNILDIILKTSKYLLNHYFKPFTNIFIIYPKPQTTLKPTIHPKIPQISIFFLIFQLTILLLPLPVPLGFRHDSRYRKIGATRQFIGGVCVRAWGRGRCPGSRLCPQNHLESFRNF